MKIRFFSAGQIGRFAIIISWIWLLINPVSAASFPAADKAAAESSKLSLCTDSSPHLLSELHIRNEEPYHESGLIYSDRGIAPQSPKSTQLNGFRIAVIGDFGNGSSNEALVAAMVAGWYPDIVLTTGDNNYPDGAAATIDEKIGQFYSQFIGNYQGSYGNGSIVNRFYPSLGNHDWHSISCNTGGCSGPYFDYFSLPNNERYYDVDLGLVHLYALDSYNSEPDGIDKDSHQAAWLRNKLSISDSCFDLVYFHHSPYSSGRHGSIPALQWPFHEWGADVVISAHDHTYERLDLNGFPYFVNGAGGASLYEFTNIGNLPNGVESIVRYNQKNGAMLITANEEQITYQFFSLDGQLVDELTSLKSCGSPGNEAPIVEAGSDQTVILPASPSLDGTVIDDGQPNPPGELTTSWSLVSGPGSVTFADASAVDTKATFSTEGAYLLRLTANDGTFDSFDELTVTMKNGTFTNQEPVVDAGFDQVIDLTEVLNLDGHVHDDGLPYPPGEFSVSWSKVSGPGEVQIADSTLVDTTASFSEEGLYLLRLVADDGDLISYDEVSIEVNAFIQDKLIYIPLLAKR